MTERSFELPEPTEATAARTTHDKVTMPRGRIAEAPAMPTRGAATIPTMMMYISMSPTVMRPASTSRPPMMISSTPMMPVITMTPEPTSDVPVIDLATLASSRCTPSENVLSSRSSAV